MCFLHDNLDILLVIFNDILFLPFMMTITPYPVNFISISVYLLLNLTFVQNAVHVRSSYVVVYGQGIISGDYRASTPGFGLGLEEEVVNCGRGVKSSPLPDLVNEVLLE